MKKQYTSDGKWSLLIIVVMLILIAIPVAIISSFVFEAYSNRGEPIVGARYHNDLPQKITGQHIKSLKEQVASLNEVAAVDINLQSAQLKIYAQVKEEVDESLYGELVDKIYQTVQQLLPIETYFTSSDQVKNYDLEIHAYNQINSTEQKYMIGVKNSSMSQLQLNHVSAAKDLDTVESVHNRLEQKQVEADQNQGEKLPAKSSDSESNGH